MNIGISISPALRAWCVDAGERIGSTFLFAFIGVFGVSGIPALLTGHVDRAALSAAGSAGIAAVLSLIKAAVAARFSNTVSPASLAPQQQPGQAQQQAPSSVGSFTPPAGTNTSSGTSSVSAFYAGQAEALSRQVVPVPLPEALRAHLELLPPPSGRKTGSKPLTPDARDLRLKRYLTSALPEPPKTVAWQKAVPAFPMLLNDRIGDCVWAGILHQQQVWAAAAGNPFFTPTDAMALALYEKVTGYNPNDPSTDQGTDPRAALKEWKTSGAAGHKILAYAAVEPTDHHTVKQAINLFGGLGVCLNLPKYAETEHGEWLLKRGGGAAPGSWGGHWVCGVGYNHIGVQLVTWGEVWTMTWGFLDRYCDGLYAAISPDWMNAAGKSPAGLDLAALTSDLSAL